MDLLTISIPTYNRPHYLEICLNKLEQAILNIDTSLHELVQINIFDNSENSWTLDLINSKKSSHLNLIYKKNIKNIGSDNNIAQCYMKSNTNYIMILGDDDFVTADFFQKLLPILKENIHDLIFLKAFGLTFNANEINKKIATTIINYKSKYETLLDRNIHLGFISSTIFKRELYTLEDIENGLGTNLVQVNLCLKVIYNNTNFIFLKNNLIASTRNNTGGYNPFQIFFINYFNLYKFYKNIYLTDSQLYDIKKRILLTFYTRVFIQYNRKNNLIFSEVDLKNLDAVYYKMLFYRYIFRPILKSRNKYKYYFMFIIYIFTNLYYYPYRFHDFIFHIKNYLKKLY